MGPQRGGDARIPRLADIDSVPVIRGASMGFVILLIGGGLAPVAAGLPLAGRYWLTVVAVVAFVVAGLRTATARGSFAAAAAVPGMLAALGGYLLVLPIVWLTAQGRDIQQTLLTAATAVLVGGLTAALAACRRPAGDRPMRTQCTGEHVAARQWEVR